MACDIQEMNLDDLMVPFGLWAPWKKKVENFTFLYKHFILEGYQIFLLIIVTIIFSTYGVLCVFKEALKYEL